MKKTALYDRHIDLGARMVPFAGFEMPVYYSSIIDEHLTVRSKVGIFDLSHMGEFEVSGPDGESFLQRMTINDVSQLVPGRAQYTAMCYDNGGIVDDCVLYNMEDHYLLVVNAANIEKDWQWLESHCSDTVDLKDISNETTLIAVQGPLSRKVLQKLIIKTELDLNSLEFYHHAYVKIEGIEMLCARTGYTGELGYELYIKGDGAKKIWDIIRDAGKEFGICPVGLGARDSLRLEMKYCLYGNDIDETTNPIEAGLGWITKLDKGDFIGKKAICAIKEKKPTRRLVSFEMVERGIPRKGYKLYASGVNIGMVTSGGHSPSLQKGIGLGYVNRDHGKTGTIIDVEIRGRKVQAYIVKPPFWKHGSLMD